MPDVPFDDPLPPHPEQSVRAAKQRSMANNCSTLRLRGEMPQTKRPAIRRLPAPATVFMVDLLVQCAARRFVWGAVVEMVTRPVELETPTVKVGFVIVHEGMSIAPAGELDTTHDASEIVPE